MKHNFAVIVFVHMMLNMARLENTALPLCCYNTVWCNDTFIDGDAWDEYYKFKTEREICLYQNVQQHCKVRVKSKVHPRKGHEGPEGE